MKRKNLRNLCMFEVLAVCLNLSIASVDVFAQSLVDVKKPFAEYQEVGILVISAKPYFGGELQNKVLANLPEDVTVILYSQDQEDLTFAEELWGALYKDTKIHYVLLPPGTRSPKGISYFAIDGMPYPVMVNPASGSSKHFVLVDSQYQAGFEPDTVLASITGMPRTTFPYAFDYGNFMANDEGLCLTINRQKEKIFSDKIFNDTYGCNRLIRLPPLKVKDENGNTVNKGLAHVDERVKFINRDTVVTDSKEYKKILEKEGIKKVILVPEASTPANLFRTYINARLINNIAFVPVYNTPDDQSALDIYKDLGFAVVPINSIYASDFGHGSIHCATATYPPLPDGLKLNFYTN